MCEGGRRPGARRRGRRRARIGTLGRRPRSTRTRSAPRCSAGRCLPSTSAAASVMRRRRMYSESGMPASDENIRRRWYSVVPSRVANVDTSMSSVSDPRPARRVCSTQRSRLSLRHPPFRVASRAPYYRGPIGSRPPPRTCPRGPSTAVWMRIRLRTSNAVVVGVERTERALAVTSTGRGSGRRSRSTRSTMWS